MLKTTILFVLATAALAPTLLVRAAETPTTAPSTQPVNKFCAVNTKDEVDPKVTTIYKGQTIGFCCEDCIKDFNKDPEKYVAKMK